jgi:hypothetical protein
MHYLESQMRMQHKHKKPSSTTPDLPQSPTDTRPTKRERVVYFSFFLVAPLTFAVPLRVFCLFLRCLPVSILSALHFTHIHVQRCRDGTYAVVWKASQSCLQIQHGLICSGARTSSTPRANRRPARNQLSFHRHIESGDRKR